MHGVVAHETVRRGNENPLQDAVTPPQGPRGDTRLLSLQQRGAGLDGRPGGLAAQGRGRDPHPGVATQALGLPCLVV